MFKKTLALTLFLILFIVSTVFAGALYTYPKFKAFDSNGDPLVGGKLYTYIADTTTNKATYSDKALTVPNLNPVILDGYGECVVYGTGQYKFILYDADDNLIWSFNWIDSEYGYLASNFYFADASLADQGAAVGSVTVKDFVDAIGLTKKATIAFTRGSTGDNTDYTFLTSETIPSNITVLLEPGARISVAVGKTVTINGPFLHENDLTQKFAGAGLIVFGSLVTEVYPEWWGIDGTDDQIEIDKAEVALTDGTVILSRDDSYAIDDDLTVDKPLWIKKGAICEVANTKTFTINTLPTIKLYQVFSGAGTVTFGPGSVKEVYPEWWGNNTTPGTTDMTAEIQAAIDTQMPVKLGVSRYYITDTLTFTDISGTAIDYGGIFQGSGMVTVAEVMDGTVIRGTVLVTPADFDKALFYMDTGRNITFRDFTVVGPAKGYGDSIAFHFDGSNMLAELRNVGIVDWETGCQSGHDGGAQANDSEFSFYSVYFGETTYCTRMYNSQAYNWHFYNPTFYPSTDYTCKVETSGAYQGNRIRIQGGFIGSAVKIFEVSGAWGMVTVIGAHFESGAIGTDPPMIFDSGAGGANVPLSCILIGNEFNYEPCLEATTVQFIRSNYAGPIVMIGNKINHPNPIIEVQRVITLSGNFWYHEPLIYRSDSPFTYPPVILQGESYMYYNGVAGDSVARSPAFVYSGIAGTVVTYSTAVPTEGSFAQGSIIWKTDVAAGGSPGWICTENGTYGDATDNTGDTDGSTAVITGMTDTSDFNVGDYVTVSAGFPSATIGYRILKKTATSITLDTDSTGASANVTVATPDPVWKAMADIAA